MISNRTDMDTFTCIVKIAVMVILFSASFGCGKTIMHLKYGLTQPKAETPATLLLFLEKHHFPTDNQYMFADSGSFFGAVRSPLFLKHMLNHMIFDREGTMLVRDTTQCQWSGFDKIKFLNPDSAYEKCNELKLDSVIRRIHPVIGNPLKDDSEMEADFTIVVTWAKFIGAYNYRLFNLEDAVKQNNSASIRLIWLNVDMQESWKLTREQKMAIK